MNSRQRRKKEADLHNKKRREAHVEAVRLAQDKLDNPEKYKRARRRATRKVMPFIAMSAVMGIDANIIRYKDM